MKKNLQIFIPLFFVFQISAFAQLTMVSSFDPEFEDDLCGIGYDADSNFVWIYGCFSEGITRYTADGVFSHNVNTAGGIANDVDLEITTYAFELGGTTIPKGQLLFINGEEGPAEIYAINLDNTITDTLVTNFGVDHVVGGSTAAAIDGKFYLVQDDVPGAEFKNRIAEIAITGDTIQTFFIGDFFDVSYGDLEVDDAGNLFVVSSVEDSIAVISGSGELITKYDLPDSVATLSGIALDCSKQEAWVSSTNGTVYRLGNFPCEAPQDISIAPVENISLSIYPNPFTDALYLNISTTEPKVITISIYNHLGQEVITARNHNSNGNLLIAMDTHDLQPGIYLIAVESGGNKISEKVVCVK
ncbi:MAG: T9SS type A sorting domain-containing protein [Chitinophagales bacterium]